jgi:putative heme iron utilization protein
VGEDAVEASMTAVDRFGFNLRLKSGERVYGRRVTFPREATSSEAARAVLIEMARQARSAAALLTAP